ncbi:MAG: amino acid permease [Bacteroidota bacterium]
MRSPNRPLGFWFLLALVMGNMIGSGIFLLPASLAPYGLHSLWGWGLSTFGAVALAFTFSQLSRSVPLAGGPFAYTRTAFGDFAGFFISWGYWICLWVGSAAIAVAFTSYSSYFFPSLSTVPWQGALYTIGAVWLVTFFNLRGLSSAGRFQIISMVIKLLPLLLMAGVGIFYFEPDHIQPSLGPAVQPGSGWSATAAVAALTLWSFLGMESATVPERRVKNARRNIPRATLWGTLIASALFILSSTAVLGLVPTETLAATGAPFAEATRVLLGDRAGSFVAFCAAISCLGALNGWVLIIGQLPQSTAKQKLFPALFAHINGRGAPDRGLVLSSLLITALIGMNYTRTLVEQFEFIVLLSTLANLLPYLFSTAGLLWLSFRTEEKGLGKYRLQWGIIAILAFSYSLWAVYGTGQESVFFGFILLMTGLPVYAWLTRNRPASP